MCSAGEGVWPCNEISPPGCHVCTRPEGHDGRHQAHDRDDKVVYEWGETE